MATSVVIKKGDTFPPLETTLTQTIETVTSPVNLGTVPPIKIQIIMKNGATKLTGTCERVKGGGDVTAGESGKIRYKWPKTSEKAAAESENRAHTFGVAGKWQVEWLVEWAAGEVESFPNEGTDEIEIAPTL